MTDAATDLLDRFGAYHTQVDHVTPLWDSQLEQVERWPATSREFTADVRGRMLAFRAEALALVEAGDELAPSLRTVADSALLLASTADAEAELMMPHPELGLHGFLFWAVNAYPLRTAEHGQRWLDKLAGLPGAVDELRGRLEHAARAGRAPLARHSRRAAEKIEAHLALPVAADPLLQQAPPTQLDDAGRAAWRERAAAAVATHVRPALAALCDTLRGTSLPAGREDERCGLLHRPDGEADYALMLEGYTAAGLTPQAVHDTGLEQVALLGEQYRELGARVLGTTDLAEVFLRLREDPSLRYGSSGEVVAAAVGMHRRAEELAPAWFLRTPRAPCDVRATAHGTLAFYSRPAPDGSRPGVFFFNTSDPGMWGTTLAATVFHEGIPGHHFQLALALEDQGLHDVHRDLLLPAFAEGWALYAERLADDMGLYASDLERLGMLASDSLRACRLVVDTGMHALGWTRQQAIDYLLDNSPLGEPEVTAEVDRYIGMPGQATSYMVGRLWIERLRDAAADRLGDAFDLRAFHDVVLSRGAVSLPALELMVRRWVDGLVAA